MFLQREAHLDTVCPEGIRTLHYYDRIGLLHPTKVTEAGYRLYDDTALERLQCIMLLKAMEFPLKEIGRILESPDSVRNMALEQQIRLLEMKKEHLENLIDLARGITAIGVRKLDFSVFDTRKMDAYAKEAKKLWGETAQYQEYEEKSAERSREEEKRLGVELMGILAKFGQMKELAPEDEAVQSQVRKLQEFISEHYYTCTKEILSSLGRMYAGGGSFTENINQTGGKGTAEFAHRAIEAYCGE